MPLPKSCAECPAHRVVADPDPEDWFNDDDVAVLCAHAPNEAQATDARGSVFPHRPVAGSLRPYEVKRICKRPSWCPLAKGKKA